MLHPSAATVDIPEIQRDNDAESGTTLATAVGARRARRRFGAMQGCTGRAEAPVSEENPKRLPPSTSFFHPDVCKLIQEAEFVHIQVDNCCGRSRTILVPSIACAASENRAHRRNGTVQGFGAGEISHHVPKQHVCVDPPRMPVRRLTDEDAAKVEEGADYGDGAPGKRRTNEDVVISIDTLIGSNIAPIHREESFKDCKLPECQSKLTKSNGTTLVEMIGPNTAAVAPRIPLRRPSPPSLGCFYTDTTVLISEEADVRTSTRAHPCINSVNARLA